MRETCVRMREIRFTKKKDVVDVVVVITWTLYIIQKFSLAYICEFSRVQMNGTKTHKKVLLKIGKVNFKN